ncbi:hypothetical protein BDZ45DRAFT_796260 [Acephala macrosclerotiorum]|nr:hypothetical protein BDZ45DRAFT_796260 [Acephala macrosclerotiorum]
MAFNNTLSYQNSTQPLSCDKISSPMAEAFPPTIIGLVVLLLGSSWMFFLFGMQRGIRGAFKLIMEADEALYRERPSDIPQIYNDTRRLTNGDLLDKRLAEWAFNSAQRFHEVEERALRSLEFGKDEIPISARILKTSLMDERLQVNSGIQPGESEPLETDPAYQD